MSNHSSEEQAAEDVAAASPAVPEPPEHDEPGPRAAPAPEEPAAEREPGASEEGEETDRSAIPEDGDRDRSAIPEDGEGDWAELAEQDPRSKAALLAELDAVEDSRDDYLEALQRARAEFDNYRKRMMREGTAQRERGKAEVVEALLGVLDDFDRTLEAARTGGEDDDGLVKGVHLVYGNLVDALRGVGLARIDDAGVAFDPNRHEAVQQREADGGGPDEPVVAEVLRPGYEMAGRVIRPAMVAVER